MSKGRYHIQDGYCKRMTPSNTDTSFSLCVFTLLIFLMLFLFILFLGHAVLPLMSSGNLQNDEVKFSNIYL